MTAAAVELRDPADVGATPRGSTDPVTYTYDAIGLRTSRTRNATTVRYRWDRLAPNPLLLDDGVHAYLYGPGGIALEQVADDDSAQLLHTDGLGSIRALSDTPGTLVGAIAYTPYGSPEHQTGQTSTLGYTGELTDPATGLIYLRARDYDPATAAFLTRDPIEPTTRDPYNYTGGDPLNHTDPSGLLFGWAKDAGNGLSNASVGALDSLTAGYSTKLAGTIFGFDPECADFGSGFGFGHTLGLFAPGPGKLKAAEEIVGAAKAGRAGLDDLANAAGASSRGRQTAAGRAIQKHGDRPGSIYPRTASPAERSRIGQELVEDYLTHPQARERVRRDGVRLFELPDGRGVAFNADDSFRGFLASRP